MVLVKNFSFLILDEIGLENAFKDILERLEAFLDYKNMKSKKSQNWDSSKEVSPRF